MTIGMIAYYPINWSSYRASWKLLLPPANCGLLFYDRITAGDQNKKIYQNRNRLCHLLKLCLSQEKLNHEEKESSIPIENIN